MGNKEILKRIQDSAIDEYNRYKERISGLPGKEIFNKAKEIYAYECIVSYFKGIDIEDDYDRNISYMLVELYGDVPNDIIDGLVNEYYGTGDIDLGYWGGVEELIEILYKEKYL